MNRSLRRLQILLAALLVAVSAAHAASQGPRPLTLEALSREWSAGAAESRCVPSPDGVDTCHWAPIRRGMETSELTGYRSDALGLSAILWSRVFADSAGPLRLIDSLDSVLRAAGLQVYDCRSGAKRWQRADLVVHLVRAVPGTSPGPKLVVSAYSDPSLLPGMLCPEAPVLPANPPRRRGPG